MNLTFKEIKKNKKEGGCSSILLKTVSNFILKFTKKIEFIRK